MTETRRHFGPLATASTVSVKKDHSDGTDREHHAGLATSKRGSARMPTPSCYDRTLERATSFVAVAPPSNRTRPKLPFSWTVGNRDPPHFRETSAQGAHSTIKHDQNLELAPAELEVIEQAHALRIWKRLIGGARSSKLRLGFPFSLDKWPSAPRGPGGRHIPMHSREHHFILSSSKSGLP